MSVALPSRAIVRIALVLGTLAVAHLLRLGVVRDKQAARVALPVVVTPAWLTRLAALGHDSFAADVYWIRALQYFGDARYRRQEFTQLAPLLDATVELDPKFCAVYRTAGLMLTSSERMDIPVANHFMQKGIENCPNDWRLGLTYGFSLYYFESRFEESGNVLAKAAKQPDAPSWVGDLAVRVLAHSGSLSTAEQMLNAIIETTTDDKMKADAEERLKRVHTEALLRALDDAARRYHDANGKWPADPKALTDAHLIPGRPVDPSGGVLTIDAEGRAQSSAMPKRLRLNARDLASSQPSSQGAEQ